jgi:hypothetical protein
MFKINLSLIFLAVLNTFADSRKLEKMEVGKIILLVKKARKQAAKRHRAATEPGERLPAVPDDPTPRREEHLHIELQQRMKTILAAILTYTPRSVQ